MKLSKTAYWSIVGFILISALLIYLTYVDILKAWIAFGLILLSIFLFIGYMWLSVHYSEKHEKFDENGYPIIYTDGLLEQARKSGRKKGPPWMDKEDEDALKKDLENLDIISPKGHGDVFLGEHYLPVRETHKHTGTSETKQNWK